MNNKLVLKAKMYKSLDCVLLKKKSKQINRYYFENNTPTPPCCFSSKNRVVVSKFQSCSLASQQPDRARVV